MPEYYKTQKGYCYKKTQKGGSKRISKENYEKAIIKQKGDVSSAPSKVIKEEQKEGFAEGQFYCYVDYYMCGYYWYGSRS